MKNFKSRVLQASLFVAVIIGSASCMNEKQQDSKVAADKKNEKKFNGNKSSKNDAEFFVNVAEINRKELGLGQLAQKKGNISQVKELGKMMETEHNKSLTELTALAKTKNISLPTAQTEKGQDAYDKLNEKTGSDFGNSYSDMMVIAHKNTISLFEKASKETTDPDILAWVNAKLPVLRAHLAHALSCQKECAKI
ncbi:MAG: DUF4142 domain-containing protein [Cyclobacteriaceae bacterium]|nr:DUF4142 domain-containing protein [Cyclobacteriaceae bacterium]